MTNGSVFDQRYILQGELGSGGMGVVYRAYDRATQDVVALKRVNAAVDDLIFKSRTDYSETSVALAQEFRLLSALRHPNIINVLDYGFTPDSKGSPQPYFTMQLLEEAVPITAANATSLDAKIDLLLQTLQAMRYLHRMNIYHRDLKPGNIFVDADRTVRVLDFGLAINKVNMQETVGTIAYMPPELLNGGHYTAQSDLYAIGVIMYELLAGYHPFDQQPMYTLLVDILTSTPDVTVLPGPPQLHSVVERLLEKSPQDRYGSVEETMQAICNAIGREMPAETVAVRESFLQAAQFIGRDVELKQLTDGLQRAKSGDGSAWLIGGESGVGKSRLLQELRTLALVDGALVLSSQAVAEGGSPYQLWQPIARELALRTTLSDVEAGVLQIIVPDISVLLGREIPLVEALSGNEQRERLFTVLLNLIRRHDRLVVILLEDIQWASTTFIKRLISVIPGHRLLMIATYRDDEAPTLPAELTGTQHIHLRRLTDEETAALTIAMLGDVALGHTNLIERIQTETEGNVFFLVEVLRTLADEAGSLENIGRQSLPDRIFAGGIQQIVQRRLRNMPADGQPLLQMAAILGRVLEPDVLKNLLQRHPDLAPQTSVEAWIATGVGLSVFAASGEQVQFTHDKLREHLLSTLDDASHYHRITAEAIELTYPDRTPHAQRLLHHWRIAGDDDKIYTYALLAGQVLMDRGETKAAYEPLNIAYQHMQQHGTYDHNAMMSYSDSLKAIGQLTEAIDVLKKYLPTVTTNENRAQVLSRIVVRYTQLDKTMAQQYLEELLSLVPLSIDEKQWSLSYEATIRFEFNFGSVERCVVLAEQAIEQAKNEGNNRYYFAYLIDKCQALFQLGRIEETIPLMLEVSDYYKQRNNYDAYISTLTELGIYHGRLGKYPQSLAYYRNALELARNGGQVPQIISLLVNLGVSTKNIGDLKASINYYQEALRLAKLHNINYALIPANVNLSIAQLLSGDLADALSTVLEALHYADSNGLTQAIGHVYATVAKIALAAKDYEKAAEFMTYIYFRGHDELNSLSEGETQVLPTVLEHMTEAEFEAVKARVSTMTTDERHATIRAYRIPPIAD